MTDLVVVVSVSVFGEVIPKLLLKGLVSEMRTLPNENRWFGIIVETLVLPVTSLLFPPPPLLLVDLLLMFPKIGIVEENVVFFVLLLVVHVVEDDCEVDVKLPNVGILLSPQKKV